jgi:hypothetical protein
MADETGLYNSGNNLLTSHVKDVRISSEPRLIENALLDGTAHIQTVGTALSVANVSVFASDEDAEAIDDYIGTGGLITVNYLTKFVTGYARAVPSWSDAGYRYYLGTIQILITSSGNQQ